MLHAARFYRLMGLRDSCNTCVGAHQFFPPGMFLIAQFMPPSPLAIV